MNLGNMASPATQTTKMMASDAQGIGNLTETIHLTNSPLMCLPREIRDEICAYLLNAGHLSIMRTSKQLSHEAKERLSREGVCRVKLGCGGGVAVGSFLPNELEGIQNYDIRVCFGPGSFLNIRHFFWNFKHFAGHGETHCRLECHVIIEYDTFGPELWINDSRALAAGIACLATFKKVVVVILPVQSVPRGFSVRHGIRAETWSSLRKRLESELGPSKVIGGTHGVDEEWMFRPVEFRSSEVHEQRIFESKFGVMNDGLLCVL